MQLHTVVDLAFLAVVLGILPRAAVRSARVLKARAASANPGAGATAPAPAREQILLSTIVSLLILGALAWGTAFVGGRELFAVGAFGARELLAGAAVLAGHFALRAAVLALRSDEERRHPPSAAWRPQTTYQWTLYLAMCGLAGFAEEAAYRGVVVWILAPYLGLVPTALLSAGVFAAMHLAQRRNAVVAVFLMALLQHWLVAFTGTLVLAMVQHAFYDVAAGLLRHRRLMREAAQAASS